METTERQTYKYSGGLYYITPGVDPKGKQLSYTPTPLYKHSFTYSDKISEYINDHGNNK